MESIKVDIPPNPPITKESQTQSLNVKLNNLAEQNNRILIKIEMLLKLNAKSDTFVTP
tara:strand:+ start:1468 stop:1641 length:174 start_codon:yes stop_codon:yes gene_type:complete